MTRLPLSGIRVLDLTRLLPGPFGTLMLADFGADVIKVEDADQGDPFRHVAPLVNGQGGRHLLLNRNKRSVAVNLKDPRGREVFFRLSDTAHVVFEQFRPGVVKRLGIDYETLSQRNPRLVYCSLSGFGQDGPYRDVVAHDPAYLGMAGVLSLIGSADSPPVMAGVNVADMTAGLMSALAITIALRHAEQTGCGQYNDLSIYDATLSILVTPASVAFFTGRAPRRGEERQSGRYPCAAVYACSDGQHLVISAMEPHFWANLCRHFGKEEYVPWQYHEGPIREEMFAFFRKAFLAKPRDEWIAELWDKQVCIAPVRTVDEALCDAHARHRGMLAQFESPGVGVIPQIGVPIKLSATPGSIRSGAPVHGQDTVELMREIGYAEEEIAFLAREKVIRSFDGEEANEGGGS
ncbi:MAG: CaiB/BaiF CoA transferase family protein [Chloroflexota bacterium]